jgi:hypothetical protein
MQMHTCVFVCVCGVCMIPYLSTALMAIFSTDVRLGGDYQKEFKVCVCVFVCVCVCVRARVGDEGCIPLECTCKIWGGGSV